MSMKRLFLSREWVLAFVLWIPGFFSSQNAVAKDLETVPHVEIDRYMGVWFELASYPKWFSRGCKNSMATYALRTDGKVSVRNECERKRLFSERSVVDGVARVVDEESNAKLKVKFGILPFEGDYWVIELGDSYEYAVVSEPKRESLWILSRTKTMDSQVLEEILETLQSKHGFDVSKLEWTQSPR